MKLMFASDIHGSERFCRRTLELYQEEKADKLILLGALLYHGPRNDLPEGYNPKGVIALLNEAREHLLCVRGNCDAEVDQMVLNFPILADYMTIYEAGCMWFITHGHIHNLENLPPLKPGDLLIHGHTHIQAMEPAGQIIYINPGSVSIPKAGNAHSYMIYENREFTIKDLEGNPIRGLTI